MGTRRRRWRGSLRGTSPPMRASPSRARRAASAAIGGSSSNESSIDQAFVELTVSNEWAGLIAATTTGRRLDHDEDRIVRLAISADRRCGKRAPWRCLLLPLRQSPFVAAVGDLI